VTAAVLYGFDNFISDLLASDVNRGMQPVKTPEGGCAAFPIGSNSRGWF
jgi:hypothetical protein